MLKLVHIDWYIIQPSSIHAIDNVGFDGRTISGITQKSILNIMNNIRHLVWINNWNWSTKTLIDICVLRIYLIQIQNEIRALKIVIWCKRQMANIIKQGTLRLIRISRWRWCITISYCLNSNTLSVVYIGWALQFPAIRSFSSETNKDKLNHSNKWAE